MAYRRSFPRSLSALLLMASCLPISAMAQQLSVKQLIAARDLPNATEQALKEKDYAAKAEALEAIAQAYHTLGYTTRVTALNNVIVETLARVPLSAQSDAYAGAAEHFAKAGTIDEANAALEKAGDSPKHGEAYAALAIAYAEKGEARAARKVFDNTGSMPAEQQVSTAAAVAAAEVKQREAEKALDFLDDHASLTGEAINQARIAAIAMLIEEDSLSDAEKAARKIPDEAARIDGLSRAAAGYARQAEKKKEASEDAERLFAEAGKLVESLQGASAQNGRAYLAAGLAHAGRLPQALDALAKVTLPASRLPAEIAITEAYAASDTPEKTKTSAMAVASVEGRDAALAAAGMALVENGKIRLAATAVRDIHQQALRSRIFRQLAEYEAKRNDLYHILENKAKAPRNTSVMPPDSLPKGTATKEELEAYDAETLSMIRDRNDSVIARDPLPSDIGRTLPPLYRPERPAFTGAMVAAQIPSATEFKAGRMYYMNSPYNLKFYFAAGNQDFVKRQATIAPDIINIESGVVDLSSLAEKLQKDGYGQYLERVQTHDGSRRYILRRPIIIGPNATLVISAADTDELRLSQESGAYIVNGGEMYVTGTAFTGWNEAANAPSMVETEPNQFRPFIASWSRSKLYLANSAFTALGFTSSKAYGISISSGPKPFVAMQSRNLTRPTGIIVDNYFTNMLYGFYCFEADDVVLVGNEYRDNYTYGIDPHDRSRHLTIAYNTTYGTHKKHGIIISREVNDSIILGNLTFDNHGSGIMSDRTSLGTMIYANSAFANEGDGLTIYESSCKLIAANRFFDNERSGIKARNSIDIGIFFNDLSNNKQAGVNGYALDLKHASSQTHRDFVMDPFTDTTAMTLVGNLIQANGVGINGEDISALFLKANRFLNQSPRLIRGTWNRQVPELLARMDFEHKGAFFTTRCLDIPPSVHHRCSFRDQGFLSGDGQDTLNDRLEHNYCAPPVSAVKGNAP